MNILELKHSEKVIL